MRHSSQVNNRLPITMPVLEGHGSRFVALSCRTESCEQNWYDGSHLPDASRSGEGAQRPRASKILIFHLLVISALRSRRSLQ